MDERLVQWFFDNKDDIFEELRAILEDPNHPENYWLDTDEDGHFKCHFCDKSYASVGSLKAHETIKHQHVVPTQKKKSLHQHHVKIQMNYLTTLY